MKIINSLYLTILIFTISGLLSLLAGLNSFINLSIIILGIGIYGGLFQILLFGFYGESLRTGKTRVMLGFTFFTVILTWYQWVFLIVLLYHLNINDGILYESPTGMLFVLSILLAFRVRSKNKRIRSDKVSN